MIYILIAIAVLLFGFAIWSYFKGGWKVLHQRIIGGLVLLYGVYLATLSGSYTALVLPGIGSIAIGAGTGATVGVATWLVLGTVGVVTGGIGVAIGISAMAAIGAAFGGIGGAAGGFGLQTVSYPLISPIFWIPLVVLGIYFLRGKHIKNLKMLPPPKSSD